ncbi:hypothetical protein ACFWWT_22380 [Streptomyces sp. NPDC058676]|uniref:hypothetical protein n=1 Tax=unclassified Streptomyces TaxID=2593676 RepID=UPI00365131E4
MSTSGIADGIPDGVLADALGSEPVRASRKRPHEARSPRSPNAVTIFRAGPSPAGAKDDHAERV